MTDKKEQPKKKFDRKAWDKAYRQKHPEKFAEYRRRYLKKKKGTSKTKTEKKETVPKEEQSAPKKE